MSGAPELNEAVILMEINWDRIPLGPSGGCVEKVDHAQLGQVNSLMSIPGAVWITGKSTPCCLGSVVKQELCEK